MAVIEPRPPTEVVGEPVPRWRVAMLAGEPYAYTNDELIAELNAAFAAPVLTPRRLRNWTELGLVPKPARRVPPTAADGIPRALYPWWTVHVLTDLVTERAQGTKLARLRATAAARLARWEHEAGRDVDPAAAAALSRPALPAVPVVLQRAIQAYARRYGSAYPGGLPAGVRAELVLSDGRGFREVVAIPPPRAPRPRQGRRDAEDNAGTA
jgi:hypothetical protein